jgi:hypothetical protein
MKVIFLDNDGVICLSHNWGSRFKKQTKSIAKTVADRNLPVELRFDNFDQKAIKVLNQILEETDAEIVISSDWRTWATLEELGQFYLSQGIIKKPIALTPLMKDFDDNSFQLYYYKRWFERIRILEIQEWLKNNQVDKWVAIDDLNMSPQFNGGYGLENFVLTPRSTEGIKQSGIKEKIVVYLK